VLKAEEPLPKVQRKKASIPIDAGSDSEDYDIDSLDDLDLEGSDIDLGSGEELDDEVDEDFDSDSDDDEDDQDLMYAYDEELDLDEDDGQEHEKRKRKRAEGEADYETSGRTRWVKSAKAEPEEVEVGRLPIKLPTGEVQMVAGSTKLPAIKKKKVEESESEEEVEEEEELDEATQAARMASQRGKFGRMGIAEIVGRPGWKNADKLEAAKEQIAGIGAEILAGGELIDNVSLAGVHSGTIAEPSGSSLDTNVDICIDERQIRGRIRDHAACTGLDPRIGPPFAISSLQGYHPWYARFSLDCLSIC
jgi:nucleolar complex protein 3